MNCTGSDAPALTPLSGLKTNGREREGPSPFHLVQIRQHSVVHLNQDDSFTRLENLKSPKMAMVS